MWSWLRKQLTNPNVHLGLSLATQAIAAASIFVPVIAPAAPILATIAGSTTLFGLALPEDGSLHADNYKQLANQLSEVVAKLAAQIPSRQ